MVLLSSRLKLFLFSIRKLNVPAVVEQEWLAENLGHVKVVDATFPLNLAKPDHTEFMTKHYGQFERLQKEKLNKEFLSKHIQGAVHFNLDVGSYPGRFARYDLYPPKLFEQYMQLLGLNNNDQIVVYGRGKGSGMMFAARVWWILKIYGHEAVSVLNQGFEKWEKDGCPISSSQPISPERGNWMARHPLDAERIISFEELTSQENERSLLKEMKCNLLDNRVREQFNGTLPLGFPAKNAKGSRLKGSKSLPINQVVDCANHLGILDKSTIKEALEKSKWDSSQPTILVCNRAIQTCLIALVMEHYGFGIPPRVYNGSLEEIAQRDSSLISEGK